MLLCRWLHQTRGVGGNRRCDRQNIRWNFGICQETQKPIKEARLKVVPFTRFSLEGQPCMRIENNKIDSGGGIFSISDSTMGEDD